MQGTNLVLNVGYHPVEIKAENGITFAVERILQSKYLAYLKSKLEQLLLTFRAVRPPEPYKGKGIVTKVNTFAVKKVKLVNNR